MTFRFVDRMRWTGLWSAMLALLLASGTARATGPDSKRFVRNHTLVSRERPPMNMSLDRRLEHVGALAFDLGQAARVQRFVFASRDEGGVPARLVIVQFESILPGAKGAYTFGIENPTRLGAHDYQTQAGFFNFDEAAASRPGAEADRTRTFLAEKGLKVEGEDFLVARYARVVDPEKRSEIIVFYYENVRALDRTRRDLERGGAREKELEGLLRDVEARARRSFAIRDASGR